MNKSRGGNWWDFTFNPVSGCRGLGRACENCFAAKYAGTQQTAHQIPLYLGTAEYRNGKWRFTGKINRWASENPKWVSPITTPGAEHPVLGDGQPSLVFVGDMADLFLKGRPIADIDKVVTVIGLSPHIGLFCTRRPNLMANYFANPQSEATRRLWQTKFWLGFSAENQKAFDARWKRVRPLAQSGFTTFVSISPMLGPVVLPPDFLSFGDRIWVICSAEQGVDAQPMDANWARGLRDPMSPSGRAVLSTSSGSVPCLGDRPRHRHTAIPPFSGAKRYERRISPSGPSVPNGANLFHRCRITYSHSRRRRRTPTSTPVPRPSASKVCLLGRIASSRN